MIKATFGLKQEPFFRREQGLLPQQQQVLDILVAHAQHGGFSVVLGEPGAGKTVLREHIEGWNAQKDKVAVAISRTAHPYKNLLKQLADAFQIELSYREPEKDLIQTAFKLMREGKTLYTLIDEAHLLEMNTLRKLRLMFDQFPKKHNLVLLAQADLMYFLSMRVNQDIKTRITYSQTLFPLNDEAMAAFILEELEAVGLGANTLNEGTLELVVRSVQGNLRLCRNLCYGALVETCRNGQRQVGIQQVNDVLIQPHWRSHEEVIRAKVK